jgi:general secretion pathway protein L
MLGKTLGLDIIEDTVAAVLVKGGMHGHQILTCASASLTGEGGLDAALAHILGKIEVGGAACISAIPSEQVSYRNLSLPFKDIKKLDQTIAYELEPLVPFAVEDLVVDFAVTGQSPVHTDILAAAVKKSYLREYLSSLERRGIGPEVVDIRNVPTTLLLLKQEDVPENGLFIDFGQHRATILFFLNKRIVMIRKVHFDYQNFSVRSDTAKDGEQTPTVSGEAESACQVFCRTILNTLMAFVDQNDEKVRPEKVFITGYRASQPEIAHLLSRFFGLPVEVINFARISGLHFTEDAVADWQPDLMNGALALALRENKQGLFNFRKGEFEAKKQFLKFRKDIRNGAIIFVIIMILGMIDFGLGYFSLKKRYDALDEQVLQIFTQTFPDVKRIVDPLQQMRVKVEEMRKTAGLAEAGSNNPGALELLADISRRIPPDLDVEVSRIVIDQEGAVIKGSTDTFNTVDSIKQGLSESSYYREVTISSANLDRSGNRVQFEVRSQLAQ